MSPGCSLLGKGLSLGSPLSHAILRFVAAISNIFFMASKERIFISFPKYLILGPSNVLKGKMGSLPNMRKKGDSFECSFGMELYAAHANGTKTSHSNCGGTCLAVQALIKEKHGTLLSCYWMLDDKVEYKVYTLIQVL